MPCFKCHCSWALLEQWASGLCREVQYPDDGRPVGEEKEEWGEREDDRMDRADNRAKEEEGRDEESRWVNM